MVRPDGFRFELYRVWLSPAGDRKPLRQECPTAGQRTAENRKSGNGGSNDHFPSLTRLYGYCPESQASVMQMESRVRPSGGASSPDAIINLRRSAPASGWGMADCTPTRTRPSA